MMFSTVVVQTKERLSTSVLVVNNPDQLLWNTSVRPLTMTSSVDAVGHHYSCEPNLLLLTSVGCLEWLFKTESCSVPYNCHWNNHYSQYLL